VKFLIPESKKSRVRVALIVRGLNWWLAGGDIKRHPLDLIYKAKIIKAPSEYWHSDMGLKHIWNVVDNDLLQFVASTWQGSITDLSLFTAEFSFRFLTGDEQVTALRDARFYSHNFLEWQSGPFPIDRHKSLSNINEVKMKPSDKIPPDTLAKLEMHLASLEQALLNKDPMMPMHLRNSHALLISYPETVHLLEDHEIARLIDAAELHTKTEIVKATASKAATGTKKKVTAADL